MIRHSQGGFKTVDSVLQIIEANMASFTRRVLGELDILQSSVICYLHDHSKNIQSYRILHFVSKILQNFWLIVIFYTCFHFFSSHPFICFFPSFFSFLLYFVISFFLSFFLLCFFASLYLYITFLLYSFLFLPSSIFFSLSFLFYFLSFFILFVFFLFFHSFRFLSFFSFDYFIFLSFFLHHFFFFPSRLVFFLPFSFSFLFLS